MKLLPAADARARSAGETAILDAAGEALNPPGSLTGIPPHKLAAAMAEIQAR